MKLLILAVLFLYFILTSCSTLKTNQLIRSYEITLAGLSPMGFNPKLKITLVSSKFNGFKAPRLATVPQICP